MRIYNLFIGLGIALITTSVSAWLYRYTTTPPHPGQLMPRHASIEWRSPEPGTAASSAPSKAKFEIINVGGTPVRILAVHANCGCASVRADSSVVSPAGRATVEVEVDPLDVGVRPVSILLDSDSSLTPQVRLQLLVIGHRRPPYILQLAGDLFYRAGYLSDEVREVLVSVVEEAGTPHQAPDLSSDLPFLQIGPPKMRERNHVSDPKLLVRTYRYELKFSSAPPDEAFVGEVSVSDPWHRDRLLRLNVHGEANPPIRIVPSRLIFVVNHADSSSSRARFLASATRTTSPVRAEMEEGDESALSVEAAGGRKDDAFSAFEVRVKPGRPIKDGVHNIVVRSAAPDSHTMTIPVLVKWR